MAILYKVSPKKRHGAQPLTDEQFWILLNNALVADFGDDVAAVGANVIEYSMADLRRLLIRRKQWVDATDEEISTAVQSIVERSPLKETYKVESMEHGGLILTAIEL